MVDLNLMNEAWRIRDNGGGGGGGGEKLEKGGEETQGKRYEEGEKGQKRGEIR